MADSANGDTNGGSGSGANEQKSGDVCRDYLRKVCTRGSTCKYVHPVDAEKKLEFCHDYQNSICGRRNCKFIHCSREDEEYYLENGVLPDTVDEVGNRGSNMGASAMQVGLCRDFLIGKCTRGARCKFRHQSERDMESEHMRGMRGARSGVYDHFDDGYGYGGPPFRRPGPMDAYRAISRYGRPGGYNDGSNYLDFESGRQRMSRPLEEENARLRKKIELLRNQVDDLTSTNEVLLQQNAQLRTGAQADVAQMQLAMMPH